MQVEWKGHYRPRHDVLRIIFTFDQASDTVVVGHIGPRGDIYK